MTPTMKSTPPRGHGEDASRLWIADGGKGVQEPFGWTGQHEVQDRLRSCSDNGECCWKKKHGQGQQTENDGVKVWAVRRCQVLGPVDHVLNGIVVVDLDRSICGGLRAFRQGQEKALCSAAIANLRTRTSLGTTLTPND